MVTMISCERRKQNDYTNMFTMNSCERRKQIDYANMVTMISCERGKQTWPRRSPVNDVNKMTIQTCSR